MSADISELTAFASALRKAAHEVRSGTRPVVSKGGLNVKDQARKNLRATHHRPTSVPWLLAGAVTYDVTAIADGWEAEIGPDQSISGLGRGTEFGSQHHAPIPFLIPAYDDEAPRFEEAAGKLLDKLL